MPLKDMATSTSTFGFIRYNIAFVIPHSASKVVTQRVGNRTLGGTVGISIGQAIFSSVRAMFPYS
jgi:hypothetical protein